MATLFLDRGRVLRKTRRALLAALEREHGMTRRQLLKLGAAGRLCSPASRGWRRPRLRVPTAARPSRSRCPRRGSRFSARTPRCAGSRSRGWATRLPTSASSCATTRARPSSTGSSWRLKVFGSGLRNQPTVDPAVQFSLDDLKKLPATTTTSFIECAGNGRSFYASQQGTPAAGTAGSSARRGRRLDRCAPRRRAGARRASAERGRRDAFRPRQHRAGQRRRRGTRAPAVPGLEGPRRRTARVRDER